MTAELEGRVVLELIPELLKRTADFRLLRPGVEIATLYEDPAGASAALLRYAPGAEVPRHRHPGYEHIFVLEGEQSDDRGVYRAGTFAVNRPGTEHRVWSSTGCLALLIWQLPVVFLASVS